MIRVLIIAVALLALTLTAAPAAAARLDQDGCLAYSVWSRDLIWARDVGADRDKVRESLEAMRAQLRDTQPGAVALMDLLLRDLDGLWRTTVARDLVLQFVLRDCLGRRGVYDEDV